MKRSVLYLLCQNKRLCSCFNKSCMSPEACTGLLAGRCYLSAREREVESVAKNQVLITTAAMVKFACN